ncbi:Uncharacterised protein [Mycobacteroides abscessus subsp. abscessus]|nr:Uncharacterised protein [Mycobacteroides abscessus subsp. abscessus]
MLGSVIDGDDLPALPVAHRRPGQDAGAVIGGVDGEGGIVAARNDHVADSDVVTARPGYCRRLKLLAGALSDSVVVDPAIERVGDLDGVGQQQAIFPSGEVSLVGVQGVGGHGDLIPTGQAVVVAVPVDRAAHRRGPSVAQRQGRGAFGGVVLAPHLGQALSPGQLVTQLSEHPAARFDRR